MITLHCGKHSVSAASIEQGLQIIKALENLEAERARQRELEKQNHGHNFQPYNAMCGCGVSELDYLLMDRRQVCVLASSTIPSSREEE